MCYQLPGLITKDGRPILGGPDINASDRAFAKLIYPVFGAALQEQDEPSGAESYDEDAGYVFEPAVVE
jgi:hypothetical protein